MLSDVNKFKLGLFVVGSFVIFLVIISALGCFDHFRAKAYIMTMVDESVQGLNSGSAVKYKGVPIGTVTDITINTQGKRIRVDMQINLSKFKTESIGGPNKPDITREQFYEYIKKEVADGLRCQIEPDGITGMKYIELNFTATTNQKFFMEPGFDDSQIFYIPSVPSLFTDLRSSVTGILSKLEAVDYQEISRHVVMTLDSADKLIKNPELQETLANVNKASGELLSAIRTVNHSLSGERIDDIVRNLSKTVKSFDELADYARKTIETAEIGKTTETLRSAFHEFIRSNRLFGENMMKFSEGMDALTELIQYLDSDPASLISGKSKRQVLMENAK